MSSCSRLHATRLWLDRIVIGQRLCPFAPPVRSRPHLNLLISHAEESNEIVYEVASAATALRKGIDNHNSSTTQASSFTTTAAVGETTLIVLNEVIDGQPLSWRDLISLSWRLQEEAIVEAGHGSFMQLVLFHPNATHNTYVDEGAPADAGDYTIRSPYPIVQLLRECDILAVVQSYPNVGNIPSRNRVRLRAQGLMACEERLRGCRNFSSSALSSSSNSHHQTMIGCRLFLSTNVVTSFRVPLTIADIHLRHEHLPFLYVFRSTLDQTKLISSLIEVIRRYPILGATLDLHSKDGRMPALECNVGNTVPMSFGTSDMTLEEWRREKRSGRMQHGNWRGGGGAPRISSLFDDLSPTRWDEGDEGERKVDLVSTVRITYFKDYGTAVGINISHLLGDASSCFRFCQVWGRAMRGLDHPIGASNARAYATLTGMVTPEILPLLDLDGSTMNDDSSIPQQSTLYNHFSPSWNKFIGGGKLDSIILEKESTAPIIVKDEVKGQDGTDHHEYVLLEYTPELLHAMKAFGTESCDDNKFLSTNDMISALGWMIKRRIAERLEWNLSMVVNLRDRGGIDGFGLLDDASSGIGLFGNALTSVVAVLPRSDVGVDMTMTEVFAAATAIRGALTRDMKTVQDRQISSLMGTLSQQAPDQRDCFSTTSWMQFYALWEINFDSDDNCDKVAVSDGTLDGFCGRPTYPLPFGNTYSSIVVPSRNGGCTYSLLAPSRHVKEILQLHKMITTKFIIGKRQQLMQNECDGEMIFD